MSGAFRAAAALALTAAVAAGCRSSAPGRAGAPARVVVESPSGRSSAVEVEVARTPEQVERGLMYRKSLGASAGMLFVFPASEVHVFWMKNTVVPLDMIFIAEEGVVVGMVENAEPMTTTPRQVAAPSRYVLEVNAGWGAAHGVKDGDRVRFEGIPDTR